MKLDVNKLAINIDQQSTLAKLLAQENINVIHGNYRTAWFDPEKRTLALPIWKNRGKAVYDLLTGHEVGHALYTPAIGWHDAVDDIDGAPKAYLNVLEDVRIERKVQDKYPGLRSQFKKAYKVLLDEDFFGLSQLDGVYDDMLLIDRINVKYKLGDLIDVSFTEGIEKDFYLRAYKTQTFEDVVALAIEIYEYQKSLMKDLKQVEKPAEAMSSSSGEETSDEYDSSEDYEKSSQPEEGEPQQETAESNFATSNEDNLTSSGQVVPKSDYVPQQELKATEGISEHVKANTVDDSYEALESMTDKAFREHEKDLTASAELGDTAIYTINSPKHKINDVVIDYKEYYNQWKSELDKYDPDFKEYVNSRIDELTPEFKKFKLQTETAAAYMAKEFELRKAAFQYSRSTQQKTGIINMNKLHNYKFSEDIFLKSTKLANYKNHGMMMFIDFSGSMCHSMGATIRQLLNLTTFCKMVNIPFEVYAFTTRVKYNDTEFEQDRQDWLNLMDCEVVLQKFNLLNLVSSRMTRSETQESFRMLWNLSRCWDGNLANAYITEWNQLHSTPLNTSIVYANEMIKQFKLKHRLEKMTTMFLTDGESDSFQVRVTEEGDEHRTSKHHHFRYYKSLLRFGGHTLDIGNSINSAKVTEKLLETIKKTTDTTVLGFFISQYRNEAVSKVCNETTYARKDKYAEQMNKNRAIIEDNIFGYDRYFGLCQKYMDIQENDLGEMVEDGASKSKLKSAFAKMTKSKRVNRILLNAFVDAIA